MKRESAHPGIQAEACVSWRCQDGDYRSCLATLNDWQQWHINKGTYLLLREKLEVICWRNLARKTWVHFAFLILKARRMALKASFRNLA